MTPVKSADAVEVRDLVDAEERSSIAHDGLNEAARLIGELTFHLRAVLGIIDRTGGYMSTADQETLRAARKAVALG
jgi:hypothetical protein